MSRLPHLSPGCTRPFLAFACLFVSVLMAQNSGSEDELTTFGRMIPAGFVNRGVVIPSFDRQGRKSSEMRAETVVRLDEKCLRAESMVIDLIARDPRQNMTVSLPEAYFYLQDRILRSDTRSTVTRADFETSGDSMVFDSRSSMGSMTGHVRTLIFDTGAVTNETNREND
jgi:lipopolysaccharide export system protein LptC